MPRWQRQTVHIALSGGAGSSVDADVLAGLAVHRTVYMPWAHARWSVTHAPTGRHVSTANTERLARRFVREVARLVDWEQRTDLRGLPDDFWHEMDAAMKRAHGGQYVSEIRL